MSVRSWKLGFASSRCFELGVECGTQCHFSVSFLNLKKDLIIIDTVRGWSSTIGDLDLQREVIHTLTFPILFQFLSRHRIKAHQALQASHTVTLVKLLICHSLKLSGMKLILLRSWDHLRWTLFFTRISSVANVLKSQKSSLPFLYTSRWISVDTLQFAIWSPSATLCDVYPPGS